MTSEFKLGDLVKLKSDTKVMTIAPAGGPVHDGP